MGSVMSDIICPHCKYDYAMSDYYYKSGEEYIMCERCGYYYGRTIINRDEPVNENGGWIPKWKEEEKKNNHAFRYGKKEGGCSGGSLKRNGLKAFEEDVKNSPEIDLATYTYKYAGKWYQKDVITGKRTPFVGVYEEQYKEE